MLLSQARFKTIKKNIKNKSVVVWGDLILDRYLWGQVSRISPEAPVPVVNVKKETASLGGSANVAHNLKSLGLSPLLIGVCGKDKHAEAFKLLLKENGLSASGLIEDAKRPTTVKTRVVAHSQQVVRIDREDPSDVTGAASGRLKAKVIQGLAKSSGLIVSDYCKGAVTPALLSSILSEAKSKGLFVAVDPKIRHALSYKGASLITPNRREAEELTGIRITGEKELLQAGWKLQKDLELDAALITLSEEGMALFEANGEYTKIPTMASEVYDVTGAGDTVISAFTAAMAGGATLKEAAYLANCAAGIVVREMGTAVTTMEAIEKSLFTV